jgi:hypothetical protein
LQKAKKNADGGEKISAVGAKKILLFSKTQVYKYLQKQKEPFSSRKGLFLCPDARKYAALSFREGIFRRHIGGSLAEKSHGFHRVFHIKQHFSFHYCIFIIDLFIYM